MDSQSHNQKPSAHHAHKASPSDLLSSARVVAEAAKSTLRHESNKVDKGRVADAAADLLCAASHYGKLEEKNYGKYVEKAETYLHKYNATHSAADSTTASSHPSSMHSGGSAHSEGGFGKYVQMAEGVLKKR
ncbi:uncharacterized protein A4U43_C08F13960 [Asparagus officinalis]|uniref:nodulin-related protein 1-like n=1 Tax=Asparagus officinalis TaxID=4686 RepID=UPI00098E65EE|nr:nodulin-related protein 1-like [Asparagus officinalis]ONK60079.1 uncharacterized protein A4U43_C08F13960 [Asparagus officinalis]